MRFLTVNETSRAAFLQEEEKEEGSFHEEITVPYRNGEVTISPFHLQPTAPQPIREYSTNMNRNRAEVRGANGGASKYVLRPHPVYPSLTFLGMFMYLGLNINFFVTRSRIVLLSQSWALLPLTALCILLAFVFSTRGSDTHKKVVIAQALIPFVSEFLALVTILRDRQDKVFKNYLWVVFLARLPFWVIVCGLSYKLQQHLKGYPDMQLSRYMVERVFKRLERANREAGTCETVLSTNSISNMSLRQGCHGDSCRRSHSHRRLPPVLRDKFHYKR